ncbi:hypothetical protein SG0102_13690 [Intestinibaculum porci]|uniref:Uncharacterized protein n=2 Tax=Intestinibaculum porci TaxID=2487118 RepID=A0A3G9JDE0_9FIRM|nr:hypothetical protein SG0102_13690 [Intestinibaculum porci]
MLLLMKKNIVYNKGKEVSMNHKHLQMLVYTALLLGIGMILPGITMGIPHMAFEMATYGLIIGLLFARLRPQSLTTIYIFRSL